jgi:hypothetical protein
MMGTECVEAMDKLVEDEKDVMESWSCVLYLGSVYNLFLDRNYDVKVNIHAASED